jgi:Flp pilus assembly protein TadB
MKSGLVSAVALGFALAQTAVMPAYASDTFRTVAPQQFSAAELQQYGLSPEASARAEALQKQGYEVKVLSPAEAQAYQAGITDNQWLLLGILAGVIVIAVLVAD